MVAPEYAVEYFFKLAYPSLEYGVNLRLTFTGRARDFERLPLLSEYR